MKIAELFARDVTRDIPPVVYFHEQSPAKLRDEVAEYIITGGYPDDDPRHARVPLGIHEQYVRLLTAIARELAKPGGVELPASWISGFYGSGKSSFAKLLGLALDGRVLPDGRTLADALLARDDSPKAQVLRAAYAKLAEQVDAIAVVFDVGGEAEDAEQLHSVIARMVQRRLGYSRHSTVADAELRLEKDGEYEHFLELAHRTLGRDWSEVRDQEQAEERFSQVRHEMNPGMFPQPMSWFDTMAGLRRSAGLSATDTTRNLQAMLERRAKGKTLFIVVDEVSQYVHRDDDRMVKLQSFVSELGQRLKGRAWLLATGQQKLEDGNEIGKLKDRFPPALRVHLATTNIRDVVHRRLLKKHRDREPVLRARYQEHGAQLKLHGFGCADLTEEDFVEVYPMLPGHVDLLMSLTTALRQRSSRIQGDDYAIRGLLQLLGELFREKKLAEQEVGALVTLDAIYDLQQSAFDTDVQLAMGRILGHAQVPQDSWEAKVAKAVALLELIGEQHAVTDERIASCLYPALGAANPLRPVKDALQKLGELNFIGYSEREGYQLQSSAGQEWQRERTDLQISADARSQLIREKLGELMKDPERPRLKGRAFYWTALFSDGRSLKEERILNAGDEASVTLDFRFPTGRSAALRDPVEWMQQSQESHLRDRILWVAGDTSIGEDLNALAQSRAMVRKYEPRRGSMGPAKARLLIDEQVRVDSLEAKVRDAVARAFVGGDVYFRGQHDPARSYDATFGAIMSAVGSARLPQLYTHHTELAVTDRELEQLLAPSLSGVSSKFLDGGLGLLTQDGGKFIATCEGPVPKAILASIEKHEGTAGNVLLQEFSRPPYGYPSDVVRASLLALLRAKRVKVQTEDGAVLTSPLDASAREVFLHVTKLKRASLFPNRDTRIGQRDRIAMARYLSGLGAEVDPVDEALASAVFERFAPLRDQLRTLEHRFGQLPGRPAPEDPLRRLADALEHCRRARDIDPTVRALKEALPALVEGTQLLRLLLTDLSDEAVIAVREAASVQLHQGAQLEREGSHGPVAAELEALKAHLASPRPWQDLASLSGPLEAIRDHYRTRRRELLAEQEARAETARDALRARPGFALLDPEAQHHVLRLLTEAQANTTPEALAPSLYELRMDFQQRFQEAQARASERFDTAVAERDPEPVVRLDLRLRDVEVSSREELERVLSELRERVLKQLELGHKVRLG